MSKQWVVHIMDLHAADEPGRCVRCGVEFDPREIGATPPGAMVAVSIHMTPAQSRPIIGRDDLMPDEVSCDRVAGA